MGRKIVNKSNIWTVMFFHNEGTYTGIIYATSEDDAREKFNQYCPSCTIDRIKPGRLGFEAYYISPTFEEDMGWDDGPDVKYELIDSKSVQDADGFYTDYTLYHDVENDTYFCMFGDSDIYTPDPDYADETFGTEEEALDWFENYTGFADEDESLKSPVKEALDEDEIRIDTKTRARLNKICSKYSGWRFPEEIRYFWKEIYDAGVDPFLIMGYPDSVAEDGGKSWTVDYTINDKRVVNSKFIYQVYEGNGDSLKNEYNFYFS